VSRLGAQVPEEREVRARHWGGDIGRSVAQTDREDLGLGGDSKQTGTEGKDTASVGGSAFREDGDATVGLLAQEI